MALSKMELRHVDGSEPFQDLSFGLWSLTKTKGLAETSDEPLVNPVAPWLNRGRSSTSQRSAAIRGLPHERA